MNFNSQFNLSFKFYFVFYATLFLVGILTYLSNGNFLSFFTAFFGIAYAFFAGAKKFICFFFGMVYSICYIYIAYEQKLYGDVMLNFIYLPMNIIGIIEWKKNQNQKNIINTRSLSIKNQIIYSFIIIILTIIYGIFLQNLNANFAYLNSFAVVAQIIAFYLQTKRYVQNYLLVTLANITSVLIWFLIFENNISSIAQLLNMIVFLIIGIYYYFIWKKQC